MGPGINLVSPFLPLYVWSILGINILMTIVTGISDRPLNDLTPRTDSYLAVGRIFWVFMIARRIIGGRQLQGYHTAIAVV